MLATEDTGGERAYGPAVISAAICDCRVPQPAGTHPHHQFQGIGAKTTNVGRAGDRGEKIGVTEGQKCLGRRHAEWRKIDVIDIK